MRVSIFFGGPSDERGISAGSIKPWVTTLEARGDVELSVVFVDRELGWWRLPPRFYYANTCEDFEGQLPRSAALDDGARAQLLDGCDLAIPLIHGRFGEDGELQRSFDARGVPYLFSRPDALDRTLDKERCYRALSAAGMPAPRRFLVARASFDEDAEAIVEQVRALAPESEERLCAIKPLRGGSSLGVQLPKPDEIADALEDAFTHDDAVLVEELIDGVEFSCVVLEDGEGQAVALAPTAVQKRDAVYDTRSKYLHGEGARLITPLPESTETLHRVRAAARRAFESLELRDMARIDGFLRPDGEVWVTDVNGISGMGFSSFVFLQTSMVGIDHRALIDRLIRRRARGGHDAVRGGNRVRRTRVHVLLGGPTSERQVSRQSGAFVGLCLAARGFDVRFVLMDVDGRFTEIGLFLALHHDVEEIAELVRDSSQHAHLRWLATEVGAELGLSSGEATRHLSVGPTGELASAVEGADFVFLGLHGGPGEDGTLQAELDALGVPYNGCGEEASRLCSDKHESLAAIAAAALPGVAVPTQVVVPHAELCALSKGIAAGELAFARWSDAVRSHGFVIKPRTDGCSTGVKLIRNANALSRFARAAAEGRGELREDGDRILKLPVPPPDEWLVERALVDDPPVPLPKGDPNVETLRPWFARRRFVELTCAVLEDEEGRLQAATPTVAVAAASELSLEEKFQQGTGANLDLAAFLPSETVAELRRRIEACAAVLGIEGYARIDLFLDREDEALYVIEANTLCGLTEATVFYSQALARWKLSPAEVLEHIVERGARRVAALQTR